MFLGLDLGTTNVKAVVVGPDGRVAARASVPVNRYCTPDGGVEQDIDEIWQAACRCISRAASQVDAPAIRSLGISSQGGALQLLDGHERPVGRVISWLDGRGHEFDRHLVEELGTDYLVEHLGCNLSAMTLGQMLRLAAQEPDVLRAARYVGFVGDVVAGRLCGRRAHDPTSLSIGMLYNPWQQRPDAEVLNRVGIRADQLADLLPATTPAGKLCPAAAEATGLVPGIPVSPAVHDQYAASTGAGSVAEGDVCLGTGTAWVLVANAGCLLRPATPGTFVCPHPVAGIYGHLLSMTNGGSAVDWAINLLGGRDWSAETIDEALSAVPAGSDGLCFWPLLSPGSWAMAFGEPGARIDGLRLTHTPRHLLRAVVEGLACELSRHLGFLMGAGLPIRRLVLCGSAAASRVTPQIVADVTRRPVACIAESAISAFGAAVIARDMLEPDIPLGELARRLAPESQTVQPSTDAPVYETLLRRYRRAFSE
ncbi:MAG: FGGY-family carbohydrate kinase [Pirellulales bacterium]|nr:FGGY-family carbohydrate kinase [Pirellulales bacterium]